MSVPVKTTRPCGSATAGHRRVRHVGPVGEQPQDEEAERNTSAAAWTQPRDTSRGRRSATSTSLLSAEGRMLSDPDDFFLLSENFMPEAGILRQMTPQSRRRPPRGAHPCAAARGSGGPAPARHDAGARLAGRPPSQHRARAARPAGRRGAARVAHGAAGPGPAAPRVGRGAGAHARPDGRHRPMESSPSGSPARSAAPGAWPTSRTAGARSAARSRRTAGGPDAMRDALSALGFAPRAEPLAEGVRYVLGNCPYRDAVAQNQTRGLRPAPRHHAGPARPARPERATRGLRRQGPLRGGLPDRGRGEELVERLTQAVEGRELPHAQQSVFV